MSQQLEHADLSLVHLTRPPQEQPAEGLRPPLLALLHGVGSNERDLFGLAPELDPRFRIVSARGPLTRGPGRYAWFDVQFLSGGRFQINPEQLEASRQDLIRFLREAVEAYEVDPERMYLMGFSQGAIMSLTLALTEPRLLAGVAAISGRIPPEVRPWVVSPEETAGLPVMVAHGQADTVITVDWARRARETLERQRVELTYREHGEGHFIPAATLAEVTAWLTQQLNEPRWTARDVSQS
jgi:phospholipase/carboxylesterase